jgi:hypothetical protein
MRSGTTLESRVAARTEARSGTGPANGEGESIDWIFDEKRFDIAVRKADGPHGWNEGSEHRVERAELSAACQRAQVARICDLPLTLRRVELTGQASAAIPSPQIRWIKVESSSSHSDALQRLVPCRSVTYFFDSDKCQPGSRLPARRALVWPNEHPQSASRIREHSWKE